MAPLTPPIRPLSTPRGQQSPPSTPVEAVPLPEVKEPVFATDFAAGPKAGLLDGKVLQGTLHAGAAVKDGLLHLGESGFATFDHLPEFDLTGAFSLECRIWIDREAAMPVIVSCGAFGGSGWFLQRYAGGWRWHLAPISCDGGQPVVGRWVHLVGTFTGSHASLYQDGKLVASVPCEPNGVPWTGPLVIGQYSSEQAGFQVHGKIASVKLYRRALRAAEVAQCFRAGPGK